MLCRTATSKPRRLRLYLGKVGVGDSTDEGVYPCDARCRCGGVGFRINMRPTKIVSSILLEQHYCFLVDVKCSRLNVDCAIGSGASRMNWSVAPSSQLRNCGAFQPVSKSACLALNKEFQALIS